MNVSRRSKREFWRVLVKVKERENGAPFVAALYDGDGKPADLQAYEESFLGEMNELFTEGLAHQGRAFTVVSHAFICGAPLAAMHAKTVRIWEGQRSKDDKNKFSRYAWFSPNRHEF
ncbi:hypothetical protein HPB48_022127 [Haemaphysalis longicornis]|uniref:Uncharacterized protein n=1 Tax=Haemaphysalis longicornis TaxID=44386 RepID=A0A9J6FDV6_HAELO|nr:hypothetical protein HPB48_022127 [Haemaphysalis longicornis]